MASIPALDQHRYSPSRLYSGILNKDSLLRRRDRAGFSPASYFIMVKP